MPNERIAIETVTNSLFGPQPIVAMRFKTDPFVDPSGTARKVDTTLFLRAEAQLSHGQLEYIATRSKAHIRELIKSIPHPGQPVPTEAFKTFNQQLSALAGECQVEGHDALQPVFRMCRFNGPLH